jgi:4-aminobutyrate aminotransferase-like enzyme
VACAAALAVIQVIREENILSRAAAMGERFRAHMQALATEPRNGVGEIRGLGAMVAFEVVRPGTHEPDADRTRAILARAAELGLLLLSCGVYYNTIRVLVPLTVEETTFAEGLELLARAIRDTA